MATNPDSKAAELLAAATTYNEKVDVLVALAVETVSDEAAANVKDGFDRQHAVGVSTDSDVLEERAATLEAELNSIEEVLEARAENEGTGEADAEVSPSGADLSDVDVDAPSDQVPGPAGTAEPEVVPSDNPEPEVVPSEAPAEPEFEVTEANRPGE